MTTVSGSDILRYIPHRFENILVDHCYPVDTVSEDKVVGRHDISIERGEALGRDLFLRQFREGEYILLNSFIAEILALSAIINAGGVESDSIAFFAAITKFKVEGHLPESKQWEGSIKKVSDKGGFYRFNGVLSHESANGSCDIMAFYMKKDQIKDPSDDEKVEIPTLAMNTYIEPFGFKQPSMMAVSHLRGIDSESYSCICSYRYPEEHALVKGHFPDEPVMMGVMQWMMVEDAVLVWAKETHKKGRFTVACDAKILSADGRAVCDIQKVVCQVYLGVEAILDQAELLETKKVAFRSRVKPGDELLICLNITP